MLGLLWALAQPSATVECASKTAGDVCRCVNDSMWAALMPYLVGLSVSTIVGAALGAFLIRVLRNGSKPRISKPSMSSAHQAASHRAPLEGRWVVARSAGHCAAAGVRSHRATLCCIEVAIGSLCRACADSATSTTRLSHIATPRA